MGWYGGGMELGGEGRVADGIEGLGEVKDKDSDIGGGR
jgi:hypothetical protein